MMQSQGQSLRRAAIKIISSVNLNIDIETSVGRAGANWQELNRMPTYYFKCSIQPDMNSRQNQNPYRSSATAAAAQSRSTRTTTAVRRQLDQA